MILVNGQEVIMNEFPNGESVLDSERLAESAGRSLQGAEQAQAQQPLHVELKFESDADLFHLLLVKRELDTLLVRMRRPGWPIVLFIGYMPYSRMDRGEGGRGFTLKTTAELINLMDFSWVETGEPHSDVTPAVINRSIVRNVVEDLFPDVSAAFGLRPGSDWLIFPDAGAAKRYAPLALRNGFRYAVGIKHRDLDTGRIDSLVVTAADGSGTVRATHDSAALIIDDLCSFGGTFVLAEHSLRLAGFERIGLFVAHAESNLHRGHVLSSLDWIGVSDTLPQETTHENLHVFHYPRWSERARPH